MDKKELFIQKIKKQFPEESESILLNIQDPKPITFRVNTLKASEDEVLVELNNLGFEIEAGPIKNSYALKNNPDKRLSETDLFKNGKIYIQKLSSMLPISYLDPKPQEKILDMCAAPGSKTTQIAETTSNESQITAVENNRNRFFALKENLEKFGVKNATLLLENAALLPKTHPQYLVYFDKVLLDAPCSNEGQIFLTQPKTYEMWNPKSAKNLSQLQKKLISSAVHLLKHEGSLVYSTCTFSKVENEEIVEWTLKKFPELKFVEQKRVFPDQYFTAFFVAKFLKSA